MAEYIAREALIDWLTRPTGFRANCEGCTEIDCLDCIVEEAIRNSPAADVVEVVHGPMRVEVETFDDHYREHYFCPSCGIEIGHKTWNEKYQFGQGTVLHTNKFPNYCPNCGARMDLKGEQP